MKRTPVLHALAPMIMTASLSLMLPLAGCGGEEATSGGDGGSGATAGSGGAGTGGTGDVVADCEAALDARIAECLDGPAAYENTACFYEEYKLFCTTGEPQAILASMACFPADVCWSFSDSNSAESCLIDSFVAHPKEKATAVNQALCAKCPMVPDPAECDGTHTGIPSEHLPDDVLDTILTCMNAATTCSEAVLCPSNSLPSLVACF